MQRRILLCGSVHQVVLKMISILPPLLQDQLNKQRAAEMRLEAERRRLREALEAAEARATRVELGRRSLEGELQRLKLSLGDRDTESQTSQERHDSLLKQVQQADAESFYIHITEHLHVIVHFALNAQFPFVTSNICDRPLVALINLIILYFRSVIAIISPTLATLFSWYSSI